MSMQENPGRGQARAGAQDYATWKAGRPDHSASASSGKAHDHPDRRAARAERERRERKLWEEAAAAQRKREIEEHIAVQQAAAKARAEAGAFPPPFDRDAFTAAHDFASWPMTWQRLGIFEALPHWPMENVRKLAAHCNRLVERADDGEVLE